MDYRVSCLGLIKKDDKYLFVRSENGWDLPGGGLEVGESNIECVVREILEELGVSAKVTSPNPLFFLKAKYISRKGKEKYQLSIVYAAKLLDENIQYTDECYEYGYFTQTEAAKLQLNPKRAGLLTLLQ